MVSLAKWLSVRLRTKWLRVRIPLLPLELDSAHESQYNGKFPKNR